MALLCIWVAKHKTEMQKFAENAERTMKMAEVPETQTATMF